MGKNINWIRGTLRQYESVASVGAWFCAQNFVKPIAFAEFLLEFMPSKPEGHALTLGDRGFDFLGLARALNEPVEVVRSLSAARQALGPLGHAARADSTAVQPFRVCPLCLHQRFHSIWHQVPWLERCVFHDIPLETVTTQIKHFRRPPQVSRDVLRVGTLKDLWFSNDDRRPTWRLELGTRRKGLPRNHTSRPEEITSDLEEGSRAYSDPTRRELGQVASIAATRGGSVVNVIELANIDISWRGLVNLSDNERRRETVIRMEPKLASAFVESHQFLLDPLVVDLRRLTCHARGERPEWRQLEEQTLAELWRGHGECSRQVDEFFQGDGPHLHAPYWSEAVDEPLLRLASVGGVPCRRLLVVDLLDKHTSACKAFQRIVAPMKRSGGRTTFDWPYADYLRPDSPLRNGAADMRLPSRPPSHIYLSEEAVRRLVDWRQAVAPFEGLDVHRIGVPVGAVAETVDEWMTVQALVRHGVLCSDPNKWASICESRGAQALYSEYDLAVQDCGIRATLSACPEGLRVRSAWQCPPAPRHVEVDHVDASRHREEVLQHLQLIDKALQEDHGRWRSFCCGSAHHGRSAVAAGRSSSSQYG